MRARSLGALAALTIVLVACGSDELPTGASQDPLRLGSIPVVVAGGSAPVAPGGPSPAPSPTPSPSASPSPSPTPAPKPTPTPTPAPDSQTAATEAEVSSYVRGGKKTKGGTSVYKPGDTINLVCRVYGPGGKPTDKHGPIQRFRIGSGELKRGTDYDFSGENSFNPTIRVFAASRDGLFKCFCIVDDVTSRNLNLPVKK